MNLTVGGYLSFYMKDKRSSLDLEIIKPTFLKSLLLDMGIPIKEIQLVILNGSIVNLNEAIVKNKDLVKVYSPIDGG